jgi:hypothetical protein
LILNHPTDELILKIGEERLDSLLNNFLLSFELIENKLFLIIIDFINLGQICGDKMLIHCLSFAEGVEIDTSEFSYHFQYIWEEK